MKRRKMAIALTLVLLGTSIPMGNSAVYGEELEEGFVSEATSETESSFVDDEAELFEEEDTASIMDENIDMSDSFVAEEDSAVMLDSGFSVSGSFNNVLYLKAGETTTLKVNAKSNYELKYQWYEDGELLEGANGDSYEISPVKGKQCEYVCVVSDPYNSEEVSFTVCLDTGLSISGEKMIWVPAGSDTELKVQGSIELGQGGSLWYTWRHWNKSSRKWESILVNTAQTVLPVENVTEIQWYSCTVYDLLDNERTLIMTVGPENMKNTLGLDFEHAKELVPEKNNVAVIATAENHVFFKFVPDKSGKWRIGSDDEQATCGKLYDKNKNVIVECTSADEFSFEKDLNAGETYYLECGYDYVQVDSSFNVKAEYVEKCNHNMKVVIDKQATCGTPGSQHKECSICGEKGAATVIPATGKHSFSEYTVTKAPTVLAAGVKTRICKVCGKTETAVVAKLNGTIKVVSAKVPLQLKKKVALGKLVTGFTTGDSINAAACTSSKPSIAAISGGNVVAKKAGTTVITVKLASGASAQVTVVVQKKAVATSSITVPSTVNLTTGEKLKLTPVVSPVTSLNKVSYTSTNKKVATVTKDGVITAKKSGTATIKVKAGKKTKNVKVKVAKKAPTGMTGVPATKTLKKGKSFTIKAKLTPSGAEATIKYSSSNKKIATVNSKGKVTAKKAGTVTITVKAGNVTKTCVVTVKK